MIGQLMQLRSWDMTSKKVGLFHILYNVLPNIEIYEFYNFSKEFHILTFGNRTIFR